MVQPSLIYPTVPDQALPRLPESPKQAGASLFTFGSVDPSAVPAKVLPRTPVKNREPKSTPMKRIEKTPKDSPYGFLWRNNSKDPLPDASAKSAPNLSEFPSKRGHRTSAIPDGFWNAAQLSYSNAAPIKRGRIFPLLLTCSGDNQNSASFMILSESQSPLRHPVAMRQLTVLDSQANWSPEEAKLVLVNEASLSLRKVIVNRNNLHNPIRQWTDATWYFTWLDDGNGASHCVIIPMVAITVKDIPLQKPERHKWFPLAPALRAHMVISASKGSLQPFPSELMPCLRDLLGDHLYDMEPSPPRPDLKK